MCVFAWRAAWCDGLSGDLTSRKIRKGSIERRQRENKKNIRGATLT